MTPTALRALAGVVEACKARDLARLEELVAEDRRLEAKIAELAATGSRDLAEGEALPLARQGVREIWAEQRIRAARTRRADLAPRIRAARADAVRSLGRHRALEHLVDEADRSEERRKLARAEREMPPAAGRVRT